VTTRPLAGPGGVRIGCVLPSVNTVVEQWYPNAMPLGVSVHFARMLIGSEVTDEALDAMDEVGVEVAAVLATCRPQVIVYACTASTIVRGREYDLELMDRLTEATGATCITATESVLRAVSALGIRSLAVASPYTQQLGDREVAFLEANGIAVDGHAHLGIAGGFDLAAPSQDAIHELARRAWADATLQGSTPDGLFIGCYNLGSHLVIDELERELGVPVLTSTQAGLWHALRLAGVTEPVPGYGRLLAS